MDFGKADGLEFLLKESGEAGYGAVLLRVTPHWIVVGAIVFLGVAILTGVKATRQKDPAA